MSTLGFGPIAWAAFTSVCPPGMDYDAWTSMRYLQQQRRTNPNFCEKSQKKVRLNRRRVNGGKRK